MTDPVKIIVGEGDITEVQVPEYNLIQTGGGGGGGGGSDGATFFPEVSQEGVISWTNDGGYDNPEPVNIKGPAGNDGSDGEDGQNGVTFTPSVSDAGIISWTNDGDLPNPSPVNIKGSDGSDGADGVSPAVTFGTITGGHTMTVTDKTHPTGQTINIMDGTQGQTGPGVPAGGTTSQVLAKASNADYVTEWVDAGGSASMTILSYGNSTWADFIAAYNANSIVYCRASSAADPSSGSQTRLAFMAYVNSAASPANVEFQYYRSVSSHTDAQQGDQVFIYKLTNAGVWSVTTREAYTKIVAGTNMSSSYANGTLTLNATGGGGGTSDYDDLTDKPSINNVTLSGNKTAAELGLGTYSKPSGGIPQTDLAQAVQNKLDNTVVVSDTQPASTATENKLWVDTDAGAGTSYQIPTVAEMNNELNGEEFSSKITFTVSVAHVFFIKIGRMCFFSYQSSNQTFNANDLLFTLPSGYRPVTQLFTTATVNASAYGDVVLNADGTVKINHISSSVTGRVYMNGTYLCN